jgi:hypothetical protein
MGAAAGIGEVRKTCAEKSQPQQDNSHAKRQHTETIQEYGAEFMAAAKKHQEAQTAYTTITGKISPNNQPNPPGAEGLWPKVCDSRHAAAQLLEKNN